jgi:predicted acyltransferase
MILTWEFIHTSEGQVLSIFSILVPSLQQIVGDGIGILIYGLSVVFFWWIVAYVLYRRKIFIKL